VIFIIKNPSTPPMKLKYSSLSLFLICLLYAGTAFAQVPDTVVVYEYVYVTDTVWVERETFDFKKLISVEPAALQVNNCSVDGFYPPLSATISENSIIREETKKLSEMKRTGFFTLLLLSVQSLTFGQAEFSVNAGTSSMWFEHGVSTISNPMWTGAHVGAELSFPIKNSDLDFSVGGKISYISPITDYKQSKPIDASLPFFEYDYAKIQTNVILNELNTGLFDTPYFQLSVPFKLNSRLGNWKPYLGTTCDVSVFLYSATYSSYYDKSKTPFLDLCILAGTSYFFSEKLGIDIGVSQGLFGKYNIFECSISPTLGVDEYLFRSLDLDISLVYIF